MATQKPTSNISYNTEDFLKEKLDTWVQSHDIQGYMFIKHLGEVDPETGKKDKDHIHLWVAPNKKLDMMDYSEKLRQYVGTESKPRGVKVWTPSKVEDWLLYVLHWPAYMSLKYPNDKGEKIPYEWTDIVCSSDTFDVENEWRRALAYMRHSVQSLASDLKNGANPLDLVLNGENVFTVNAIAKCMADTDYGRLLRDFQFQEAQFQQLTTALYKSGIKYYFDENNICHLEGRLLTDTPPLDPEA